MGAYKARRQAMLRCEDRPDLSPVVRHDSSGECLGIIRIDGIDSPCLELRVRIKKTAQGQGYGREAVRAVAEWASRTLGKASLIYPVAVQNVPSRRIAEVLGSKVVGDRTNPKYEAVVYKIPALKS